MVFRTRPTFGLTFAWKLGNRIAKGGSMLTCRKLHKSTMVAVVLAALAVGSTFPIRVLADTPDSFNISPALAMADTKDADVSTVRTEHQKSECTKECPLPIKLSVSYYLLSDRVFRGIVVS